MSGSENIKSAKLKESLARRIETGEFSFNSRFLGINTLVSEYGVSYVTASKTLKMLEEEGYIRCQRGVGYFVLYAGECRPPREKRLNLVLLAECWSHYSAHFESELARFRRAGWKIEIVPLKTTDIYDASVFINSPDAYTLIYCLSADWSRFTATFAHVCNRVVVLGKLSGSHKVTSIICDESETVRQILAFLRKKGRTRPGIFCNREENELEMYRLAYWRLALAETGLSQEWIQSHIFSLTVCEGGSTRLLQEMEYLQVHRGDLDSIVVLYGRSLFQNACQKVGIRIPEDILPVFIDTPQWLEEEKYPILDHNISAHFETAFRILEARHATGKKEPGSWYFCPPLGVCEATRRPLRKKGAKRDTWG
ncbi:MAG: GntR family transcriptional regulator [Victivallales bacterium]|nr:GntR family transcriptional regulator [Victivallales bacterium]